jgi:16S rRNA (guanine(966)-N(2))-methyltransferase RsmD
MLRDPTIHLPSGTMRVIAGIYRSRRLVTPHGLATRPTSDRLRETLFNILAPRIEGCVFADLYAGSGAVGIEALSRGARMVYFVEKAAPALEMIRTNLAALKIVSGFRIDPGTVAGALRRMADAGSIERSDVLFLDPPYGASDEYLQTLGAIAGRAADLLTREGIVVAEHGRKLAQAPGERFGALQRYRLVEQGDASLSFYRAVP